MTHSAMVTLTSYNMGDVEERDFDLWTSFAAANIDEYCGFEVGVDAARFGETGRDQIDAGDDGQIEAIRGALRDLWTEFCDGGWDDAAAVRS